MPFSPSPFFKSFARVKRIFIINYYFSPLSISTCQTFIDSSLFLVDNVIVLIYPIAIVWSSRFVNRTASFFMIVLIKAILFWFLFHSNFSKICYIGFPFACISHVIFYALPNQTPNCLLQILHLIFQTV